MIHQVPVCGKVFQRISAVLLSHVDIVLSGFFFYCEKEGFRNVILKKLSKTSISHKLNFVSLGAILHRMFFHLQETSF